MRRSGRRERERERQVVQEERRSMCGAVRTRRARRRDDGHRGIDVLMRYFSDDHTATVYLASLTVFRLYLDAAFAARLL